MSFGSPATAGIGDLSPMRTTAAVSAKVTPTNPASRLTAASASRLHSSQCIRWKWSVSVKVSSPAAASTPVAPRRQSRRIIAAAPPEFPIPPLLDLEHHRLRDVVVALLGLVERGDGEAAGLARDERRVVLMPGVELALELDRPLAVGPVALRLDVPGRAGGRLRRILRHHRGALLLRRLDLLVARRAFVDGMREVDLAAVAGRESAPLDGRRGRRL